MMNRTDDPIFIVAEAGVNHNGSLELALRLVDAAHAAGADAVKFQTFRAEKLASNMAPKALYQTRTPEDGESQLEMLRKLELSFEAHHVLFDRCRSLGIEFMSTPFDQESLDFLVTELRVKRVKLSSGEITNAPLLLHAAKCGRPLLLSTGMSTLEEVEQALGVLAFGLTKSVEGPSREAFRKALTEAEGRAAVTAKVTLLQCTSEYPAPFSEANLRTMEALRRGFNVAVGLSDHTEGITVPIAAAALGAVVIEKHFTLDRSMPGPDHKASLEPRELAEMVRAVREVKLALGSRDKSPTSSEARNRTVARRSLVASRDIQRGEKFSADNLTIKRPGNGVSPFLYWEWLGRTAERNYSKDEAILP